MAPKRPAGKNLSQDQLKALLEGKALDDMVEKISKRLKADHGMASRILNMIETGYFKQEEGMEEGKLPQSCNKFRLVHKDILLEIITDIVGTCPGMQQDAAKLLVQKIEGIKKKHEILRLFSFLCRVEEGSAIPTRDIKDFKEWCKERHAEAPRAQHLEFDDGPKGSACPAFQRFGCFAVAAWDEDKKKYTKLMHAEGSVVAIPQDWAVTAKFVMTGNWSELSARIKCPTTSGGVIETKVKPMFTQAGIDIPDPFMEEEIQTPLNCKKRGRSSSPTNSLVSTASKGSGSPAAAAAKELPGAMQEQQKAAAVDEQIPPQGELEPKGVPPKPNGDGGALVGLNVTA